MGLLDLFFSSGDDSLRDDILSEIYAGAFAGGMPAMLLDEERVRNANDEELEEIAKEYGIRRKGK